MATTPACFILAAVVTLMLVCRATSSRDRQFQTEIHKRIFCNFYGCGQKRSTGDLGRDMDRPSHKLDLLSEEVDDEDDFNPKYLLEGLHSPSGRRQPLEGRENLVASPEGEKYLHAAALWEALKRRLAVQVPNHRIAKRHVVAA